MSDRTVDGNTTVWWVTTLSSTTSPTATQIAAGVNLTGYITKDGLDVSPDQDTIDTTALNSLTETEDLGMAKVDMALTMKRQSTDTAWTTFASNPYGYLVIRRGVANSTAATAAQKCEVYTARASNRIPIKPAKNEVEKFQVKLVNQADHVIEATMA